jgi:hypothetical protein
MVLKFQGHMSMLCTLIKEMGAPSEQTPSHLTLDSTEIGDYDIFIDKGHHTKVNAPSGYKKISVNFVIDEKHYCS